MSAAVSLFLALLLLVNFGVNVDGRTSVALSRMVRSYWLSKLGKSVTRTASQNSEVVCEKWKNKQYGDYQLTITCATSEFIKIDRVLYGRETSSICKKGLKGNKKKRCGDPVATTTLARKLCDTKNTCTLEATNTFWEKDPCKKVHKYLQVFWRCEIPVTAAIKRALVCQDETQALECNNFPTDGVSEELEILFAVYGRLESVSCPASTKGTTENIDCGSFDISFKNTGDRCNGQKACELAATNEIYGDPCDKTSKYLEVLYRCKVTSSG